MVGIGGPGVWGWYMERRHFRQSKQQKQKNKGGKNGGLREPICLVGKDES